jgi:hypothetical protein
VPYRATLGLLALLGPASGCDDLAIETFVASRWDAGRECLEPSGVVDVYEDEAPAGCDARVRCWLSPDGDLFATTECEAGPGWEQTSTDDDERCDDAIEAFDAGAEGRCDEE